MAVSWNPAAGVNRTGNGGYSVLPENLIIKPDLSGRAEASDVTELAHDILVNGQLEPAVAWKDDNGWPVLAAGHRRYRAIMSINQGKPEEEKRRIQFNFIGARSEREAFDYTVRENNNRLNPSDLDHAQNVHVYQTKFGLGIKDIAKVYFPGAYTDEELAKANKWVEDKLKLLQLSDEAKEAMRSGMLSTSAALELASIPDRMTQDKAIEKAKSSGQKKIKVEEARAIKQEAAGKPAKKPISENSPAARLKIANDIVNLAGSLASELLSEDPNPDIFMDLSRTIIVKVKNFDSSMLPPGYDKKAEQFESENAKGRIMVADRDLVVA